MKLTKKLFVLPLLALAFAPLGAVAQTPSCAPLVATKVTAAPYLALNTILAARISSFKIRLDAMHDQATYTPLLSFANAVKGLVPNGRVVVTLADGTVVVDTGKGALNTYANFVAKTINENHNSRIAFLDAQLFECGIGLETKRSSTTGVVEHYVARRLGNYLDNSGTVRLSVR